VAAHQLISSEPLYHARIFIVSAPPFCRTDRLRQKHRHSQHFFQLCHDLLVLISFAICLLHIFTLYRHFIPPAPLVPPFFRTQTPRPRPLCLFACLSVKWIICIVLGIQIQQESQNNIESSSENCIRLGFVCEPCCLGLSMDFHALRRRVNIYLMPE